MFYKTEKAAQGKADKMNSQDASFLKYPWIVRPCIRERMTRDRGVEKVKGWVVILSKDKRKS
jgi:hypothetical protein